MKKVFILISCIAGLVCSCTSYDDSKLRKEFNSLQARVAELEQLCDLLGTNVTTLQHEVNTLQNGLMISRVEGIRDGYVIYFSDKSSITIHNGRNDSPVMSVEKNEDGNYYWTVNGKPLTDKNGNKVKAQVVEDKTKAKAAADSKVKTGSTAGSKGKTSANTTTKKKKCCFVSKKKK